MTISLPVRIFLLSFLFATSLLVALFFPLICNAETIEFTSGSSWVVHDAENKPLGAAQAVCLNASSPSPCPAGATQYGFSGSGWTADLTPISGAQWIWAPGITASSSPAELEAYSFSRTFVLGASVAEAVIFVAADDFAGISINGSLVGMIGSTTDASLAGFAANNLTSFDISAFLGIGDNVIEILGNGIGAFGNCTNCTYSQHPAGIVFGGSITTGIDSDGDSIADEADNCINHQNTDQRDSNSDGFGNACDADLNDDCIVNVMDLGILRAMFFSSNSDADFNGDEIVNVVDLGIMRLLFFSPPGPSGLPNDCK